MVRKIAQIFMALFSARQPAKIVTISLKSIHAVALACTHCRIITASLSKKLDGIQ